MAENPVFTDPNAYRVGVPQAARPVDKSPIGESLSRVGESIFRLTMVLNKQDQESRILQARIKMGEGFQALEQSIATETDLEKLTPMYQAGAEQLKNEALSLAKDENTRKAIEYDYVRNNLTAQANVFSRVTKMKAQQGHAQVAQLAEVTMQKALTSSDRNLVDVKEDFSGLAKSLVDMGVMDVGSAEVWRLNQVQRADHIRAMSEEKMNPANALMLLEEKDKNGDYKNFVDLKPEYRIAIADIARQHMKKDATQLSLMAQQGEYAIMSGQIKAPVAVERYKRSGASPMQVEEITKWYAAAEKAKAILDVRAVSDAAGAAKLDAEFVKYASMEGNEYSMRVLANYNQISAENDQLWKSDPAVAADRFFPSKEKPAMENGDYTFEQILRNRVSAYTTKGFKPGTKLLSKDEETTFIKTAKFEQMNPDDKANYVRQRVASYGDLAGPIMKQLLDAGAPPEVLLIADQDMSPYANGLLATTMGLTEQEAKGSKYTLPKDADDVVKTAKELFNSGVGLSMVANDQKEKSLYWESYRKLALYMGDAQAAYDALWKDIPIRKADGGRSAMRFPRGMDTDQIDGIVDKAAALLNTPELINPDIATDVSNKELLVSQLNRVGGWVTYSEGSRDAGLAFTMDGRVVLDKKRNPIKLYWRQFDEIDVVSGERGMFSKKAVRRVETP